MAKRRLHIQALLVEPHADQRPDWHFTSKWDSAEALG
jgi:hypothetical protein